MKYWYLLFIFIFGICILFFWDPFSFFLGNFYSIRLPKEAQLLDYCRFRPTFPYILNPVSAAYRIENSTFNKWISETAFETYPWQPPALDVATPTNLFRKYALRDSWSDKRISIDDVLYLAKKKKCPFITDLKFKLLSLIYTTIRQTISIAPAIK